MATASEKEEYQPFFFSRFSAGSGADRRPFDASPDAESIAVEMPIGCGRASANERLLTGNRIVVGRVLYAPRRDNAVIGGKYITIMNALEYIVIINKE